MGKINNGRRDLVSGYYKSGKISLDPANCKLWLFGISTALAPMRLKLV